ncbi:hypothetical protein V2J09_011083 [Rumex salicifolius]
MAFSKLLAAFATLSFVHIIPTKQIFVPFHVYSLGTVLPTKDIYVFTKIQNAFMLLDIVFPYSTSPISPSPNNSSISSEVLSTLLEHASELSQQLEPSNSSPHVRPTTPPIPTTHTGPIPSPHSQPITPSTNPLSTPTIPTPQIQRSSPTSDPTSTMAHRNSLILPIPAAQQQQPPPTHYRPAQSSIHPMKFITALNKIFALKDQGDLHFFLGLQIHRTDSGITLTQESYIKDILDRANMASASSISTPADPQSRLVRAGEPRTVGSLQYATITRPDVAYAVNRVCQFMHSPTVDHWRAIKRILRYLAGTLDHYLHFKPTKAASFLAYSDAGWLSDSDDSRSQFGYAIFHGQNLVSWTSRKQRVVARSSTEAEYRSLAYTLADIFTKPLSKDRVSFLRSKLQILPTHQLVGG